MAGWQRVWVICTPVTLVGAFRKGGAQASLHHDRISNPVAPSVHDLHTDTQRDGITEGKSSLSCVSLNSAGLSCDRPLPVTGLGPRLAPRLLERGPPQAKLEIDDHRKGKVRMQTPV